MKIEVDTHTHTVVSGHAFSTILENARVAREVGMKGLVMTEHGYMMPSSPPDFHPMSYNAIPDELEGVRIYRGVEANITDFDGNIDMPVKYIRHLDFMIASIHEVTVEAGTEEENTRALIGALSHPYVDVIGHPGNPLFPIDREALVKEAARLNKMLEINNHSFKYRVGSTDNCMDIIRLCKEYGARIVVSSDAHFCGQIGHYELALAKVAEAGYPEEMIVNATQERFEAYIAEKRARQAKLAD